MHIILIDNVQEPTEQFTVQLSKPVIVARNKGIGTVTILNGAPSTLMTKTAKTQTGEGQMMVNKLKVHAMPNPSNHYFTIITQGNAGQKLNITVFDVLERLVEARNNMPANGNIRIGDEYRPGIYFIKVVQGNEIKTLKLIKQSD